MQSVLFPEIDTPALLVDNSIMQRNIDLMQKICNNANVKLRPHIKTHKSIDIARKQIEKGAIGIACAKVSEALVFAEAGFKDIQIANIIVGEHKLRNLLKIKSITKSLKVCVDNFDNAKILNDFFELNQQTIDVLILVDSGYHRCGLQDKDKIRELAKYLNKSKSLNLAGITTHAGHAYGATNRNALEEIARNEAIFMVEIAEYLRNNGIIIKDVTVGSNPTARISSQIKGVTEIRTGNYVFNDMIQVNLGTVEEKDCALTVLTQVISIPSKDRVIVDAGSKSFSSDKGAHGNETNKFYGKIIGKNANIVRLSEEHGIINHQNEYFEVGERIRVIPNHACTTMNMFDKAYIIEQNKILKEIRIDARGKLQ